MNKEKLKKVADEYCALYKEGVIGITPVLGLKSVQMTYEAFRKTFRQYNVRQFDNDYDRLYVLDGEYEFFTLMKW